jgi:hypothetical protein
MKAVSFLWIKVMAKQSVVYGFSITPTQLSGVRLSAKTFEALAQAEILLPAQVVSEDGYHILDYPALLEALVELAKLVGHPKFEDPVYLSLSSEEYGVTTVKLGHRNEIEKALLEQLPHQTSIVQWHVLSTRPEKARVVYATLDSVVLEDYLGLFYEAGFKLTGIDIIPFALLRTMAASGTLDALLKKYGSKTLWGALTHIGQFTWCSVWQGSTLLDTAYFETATANLEETLEDLCQGQNPIIWFSWQDSAVRGPMHVLDSLLGAPLKPVILGPFYQEIANAQFQTSVFPALGAALKTEIDFPFHWNFCSPPQMQDVAQQYTEVPYANYQPVFSKLLLWIAAIVLLWVASQTGIASVRNMTLTQQLEQQQKQAQDLDNTFRRNHMSLLGLQIVLENKTPAEIQLEEYQITGFDSHSDGQVSISGLTHTPEVLEKYRNALITSDPLTQVVLKETQFKTHASPEGTHFVFEGSLLVTDPKLATTQEDL